MLLCLLGFKKEKSLKHTNKNYIIIIYIFKIGLCLPSLYYQQHKTIVSKGLIRICKEILRYKPKGVWRNR